MDTLAYSAMISNNVMKDLVSKNTKLTKQIKEAMVLLKKSQEENTMLLKIIELSVTSCHINEVTPPGNPNAQNHRNRKKIDYDTTDSLMEPKGHCWSCGYRVPKNHPSLNCNKQKPRHQL
eukprot:9682790-Ditylum_brightwellii.AAC.1